VYLLGGILGGFCILHGELMRSIALGLWRKRCFVKGAWRTETLNTNNGKRREGFEKKQSQEKNQREDK